MEVVQLCPTFCNPMDCSLSGSSVHGILQAKILEWVAISFSRGSSGPRNWIWVSCTTGRFFTIWATREDQGRKVQVLFYQNDWNKSRTPCHIPPQKSHLWGGGRGRGEEKKTRDLVQRVKTCTRSKVHCCNHRAKIRLDNDIHEPGMVVPQRNLTKSCS